MGVRLDLIGSLIVSAAAFSVALMTFDGSSTGGHAGIMLSYALKATQRSVLVTTFYLPAVMVSATS
jgi:hypothetical protein